MVISGTFEGPLSPAESDLRQSFKVKYPTVPSDETITIQFGQEYRDKIMELSGHGNLTLLVQLIDRVTQPRPEHLFKLIALYPDTKSDDELKTINDQLHAMYWLP